jgi:Protein of unknown function (DUF2855)
MQITEFWVKRDALRETKIVYHEAKPLADGEARMAIDKFALTSNNVSYAVTGDSIGYWKFFPVEGEWGIVPVWGFAEVIESRCAELTVGERIWGYFPMASHLTVKPGKVTAANFFDFAPHRAALPPLYNQYHRTANDPAPLKAMEDERCLLFPLFATSFVIYDFLIDNNFFGAEQVIVASASSKTAFGLAHLLHHDANISQKVVGLTSPRNVDFVKSLGVYDQVVTYDQISSLPNNIASDFVDMSGDSAVVTNVHMHFADNLKDSCLVGATHWETERKNGPLPGAKPTFFFAPARFAKRDKEWGSGVTITKAFGASAKIAWSTKGQLEITRQGGGEAVSQSFLALINNEVPPSRGLMLSLL